MATALVLWLMLVDAGEDAPPLDAPEEADNARDASPTLTGSRAGTTPTTAGWIDVTRVAGPAISLQGTVTGSGRPLPNATLAIRTLRPTQVGQIVSMGTGHTSRAARGALPGEQIATQRSSADGTFAFTLERRTRHLITVRAPGYATQMRPILTPAEGDPEPIEIELVPGFSVTGVVIDATGTPRAGIPIQLLARRDNRWRADQSLAEATTDASGRFDLGMHAHGHHQLMVVTPEGASLRTPAVVPCVGGLRVELPQSGTLEGTLQDAHQGPVGDARVTILATIEGSRTTIESETTTVADGSFRAPGLVGRVTEVTVTANDGVWLSSRMGAVEHDMTRLLPNATTTTTLRLAEHRTLSGRVLTGSTTEPVGGMHVALTHGTLRTQVGLTQADPDGTFVFERVPAGAYTLAALDPTDAYRAGYLPPRAWASSGSFDFPDAEASFDITLHTFGRVEGHVPHDHRGWNPLVLQVGAMRVHASTDPRGAYVFPHAAPAASARVAAPSLTLHGRGVSTEPFEIRPGETARPAMPHARAESLRVQGVVRGPDDTPIVGAYVSMERGPNWRALFEGVHWQEARRAAEPWEGVRTDANGRYDLPYAPRSDADADDEAAWKLRVAHPAYAIQTIDRPGVPSPGTPLQVDVALAKGRAIRGRVLQPDGSPAVGALVRIVQEGGQIATTDAEGRFALPHGQEAAWSVSVTHATGRFPLEAGEQHSVAGIHETPTLTLLPVPILAGRVVDEDGRPIPRAFIRVREPREGDSAEDADALAAAVAEVPTHRRQRYRRRLAHIGETIVARGTADDLGMFRIECERAGTFELVAVGDDGVDGTLLETVTKPFPTGTTDIVLRADTGARITGIVVDTHGKPLSNAEVIGAWPEPAGWAGGMSHDNPRPITRTDSNGRFVLRGLDEGPVGLVACHSRYRPLYEKDHRTRTDVKLVLDRGETIEGRVLTPEGEPYVGLALKLVRQKEPKKAGAEPASRWREMLDERRTSMEAVIGSAILRSQLNSRLSTHTDHQGNFEFSGLDRGRYEVSLQRSMVSVGDPLFPKTVVASNAAPLVIKTQVALSVSGSVVDQDGKPIIYYFDMYPSRPHVGCHQEGGTKQWSGETAWDFANNDGTFHVGGLQPGPVTIVVRAGDGYDGVTIKSEAGARDLRIVLRKLNEEEQEARRDADLRKLKEDISDSETDDK